MQKDDYTKMLCAAAMLNNLEGVKEALANGADPDGDKRQTPLVSSSLNAYFHEAARNMLFYAPPMKIASGNGDLEMVDLLIAAGADIDRVDPSSGSNALHWACLGGQRWMVKALMDRGADVNLRNRDGKTPRSLASAREIRMIIDAEIQRKKLEASLQRGAPIATVSRRRL